MPDAELKESMARSLQEMRHDPYETPNTGGASGSGGAAAATLYQRATPAPTGTPNAQSEGEGSVLPNRPPRIFAGGDAQQPPQLIPRPLTPVDQCKILEDRAARESAQIRKLLDKMAMIDLEFAEVDMSELNTLKQSVMACQRQIDQFQA